MCCSLFCFGQWADSPHKHSNDLTHNIAEEPGQQVPRVIKHAHVMQRVHMYWRQPLVVFNMAIDMSAAKSLPCNQGKCGDEMLLRTSGNTHRSIMSMMRTMSVEIARLIVGQQ